MRTFSTAEVFTLIRKWKEHIKQKENKLKRSVKTFTGWWKENPWFPPKTRVFTDTKTYLDQPIGIQVWYCANNTNVKQVQTFQNEVFRDVVDVEWRCSREQNTPSIRREINTASRHQMRILSTEVHQFIDKSLVRLPRINPYELCSETP